MEDSCHSGVQACTEPLVVKATYYSLQYSYTHDVKDNESKESVCLSKSKESIASLKSDESDFTWKLRTGSGECPPDTTNAGLKSVFPSDSG